NQVFWQVRFEPSPLSGAADRVMVGYKDRSIDPVQGPTTTILWRDPFLNRPEQQLMGVQFSGQIDISSPRAPYVVTNSSSWVYQGTGLADGDSIPSIVGYEMDSSMSSAPLPTSVAGTYQVLSRSPFVDSFSGTTGIANSSIYQAPSGAWVFGAGTTSWSWGLDLDGVVDPRIQRMTANLLNRFLGLSSLATPPTVAIDKAAGQADPTSDSPINFTAVFSAPVSGFGGAGVTLSGTAGGTKTVTVSGGPSTYNVAVSGMSTDGTVIASIAAGAAQDAAGNANTASTSTDNSVSFDATRPTVTINQAAGQADPTNASPINFTAVFSRPVSGFSGAGVTISGSAGDTKTVTVSGGPSTYTVAVSGITTAAPVTASIPAGAAQDAAGNANAASTSTNNSVTFTFVSPIVLENQQPGSGNWQMWLRGTPPADDLGKQIKGYASATSVNKGDSITFYVTVTPAQQFTMDVYRMGWYQGLLGRLMQSIGPLQGVVQPACPVDATTGLIECDWTASYTLAVPTNWTSGVFLVMLTNAQRSEEHTSELQSRENLVCRLLLEKKQHDHPKCRYCPVFV